MHNCQGLENLRFACRSLGAAHKYSGLKRILKGPPPAFRVFIGITDGKFHVGSVTQLDTSPLAMAFCPMCGEKMSEPEQEEQPERAMPRAKRQTKKDDWYLTKNSDRELNDSDDDRERESAA